MSFLKCFGILSLVIVSCFFGFSYAEDGVTDTEIIVGQHSMESGALAAYSAQPRATVAYFERVNAAGGIFGRKIKYLHEDTAGQWQKASTITKKMIESDKIFAMLGAMGDMHFAAYKSLAEANVPDLLFVDAISGYEPLPPMAFPDCPSFASDGKKLAEYAIKNLKGKKVCFITAKTVHEDMPKQALATITEYNSKASAKDKLPIGLDLKIDKSAAQADAEVSQLKADGCEAVFLTDYGPLAAKIINYGDSQGFRPKWLVDWFNTSSQFVALLNKEVREGIISTSFIARSEKYNVPGWKDFGELMDKYNIPKTGASASGYYIAEAFTEALRRNGKNLTRESLVKTIEGMKGYQCSLCLAPWEVSKENHWPWKTGILATIKDDVWQPLRQ